MSKNVVEPERPQMTICMPVTFWILKDTRAQSTAPVHPRLHARALPHAHTQKYVTLFDFQCNNGILNAPQCCYTYIASLVYFVKQKTTEMF
jgi:hypothetical protein